MRDFRAVPGKQAKIIGDRELKAVLGSVTRHRHAVRDRAIVLLSVKAGLRAAEIAGLTWGMVLHAQAEIGDVIELRDSVAKRGSGRTIPMHPALKFALAHLYDASSVGSDGPVIRSERGEAMRPSSIVNWFAELYRRVGLSGCSSHSGRRTFITKAARLVHRTGGSLRDVQQLAGHCSIEMTQRYIEGSTEAKRALVRLL